MRLLIMSIALALPVAAVHGRTDREVIADICMTMHSCDLPPEEGCAFPTNLSQLCGNEMQELGVDEPGFRFKVATLLTNIVTTVDVATNVECAAIASGAIFLLSEYGDVGSAGILAYVMTNSLSVSVAGEASLRFARRTLPSGGLDVYLSPVVAASPPSLKSELYGGLYAGFNAVGGNEALTNRMIGVALAVMNEKWGCWSLSDRNVCRWWPAYSSSSNRYLAVESAIHANSPAISMSHLHNIKGQLEALPAGTMTLLPTNQYSSAGLE